MQIRFWIKYYMVRLFLAFVFFLALSITCFSQDRLFETEKDLTQLFDSLYKMDDTPEREILNNQIVLKFEAALKSPNAVYFRWKALDMIGKVYSEDDKLKIYSWHLQLKNGKYVYYGLLQYNITNPKKGKKEIIVHRLIDHSDHMKNPATLTLSADNWFGALYFGIKTYTYKRNVYYALFGYDFHDNYSQKKIIEVLNIDKKGDAVFSGKFNMDFQEFKRVIFEYSDNVAMALRYDNRLGMVIYDHLSPFKPIFTGAYRFYSPDGSYDGLKFNKSVFHLEKDVDARNQ